MTYCKKFMSGIQQINFPKSQAIKMREALFISAHQTLTETYASLTQELAALPDHVTDNPAADKQLTAYKAQQTRNLHAITTQINDIVRQATADQIDLAQAVTFDDQFIAGFAGNFRNIRHLAYTLSDAPPAIKALQTKLYAAVLFNLDKATQERQLADLPTSTIQDMLEQAIQTYESCEKQLLKTQYQQIVQMGVFELVRRECAKVTETSILLADYPAYQKFLDELYARLPEVGPSPVIDNLSLYTNTKGQAIGALLFDVETKLNINQDHDWSQDEKINAAQTGSSMFHKLRFGQEDRREYLQKRQENMARDLFWARNIRDIELFTKRGEADAVFTRLAEVRFAQTRHQFQLPTPTKSPLKAKLANALKNVGTKRSQLHYPTGSPQTRLSKEQREVLIEEIGKQLKEEFAKPTLAITGNELNVNLFYFDADKINPSAILSTIEKNGGFGLKPETIAIKLMSTQASNVKDNIHHHALQGHSLADIATQIDTLKISPEQRKVYHAALERVQTDLNATEITAITDLVARLNLSNSDELILRKLLELSLVPKLRQPENLQAAFALIKQGNYANALQVENLEATVNLAYAELASVDAIDFPPKLKPIIEKAKIIAASNPEREKKLTALHAIFQSDSPIEERITQITELFLQEYQSMASTLALSPDEERRMKQDIDLMARDLLRLTERTKAGEPALTEAEKNTYFSAIKQIAEQIKPDEISSVQFKIKHSLTGLQTITILDKDGRTKSIELDLGSTPLPYSLIKPPGDSEFIFSYGGSRGIIAPFKEFDKAYAGEDKQKGRFFTHSRLLGVGQYGSVKEVEGLLSGLNQVIKKGYVPTKDQPSTFHEVARTDLRTRPITARDDPLYRIESDILKTLSKTQQANKKTVSNGTEYWLTVGKKKHKATLFQRDDALMEYQLLTERAQGDTFADTANRELNKYSKSDLAYHNPEQRHETDSTFTLKDKLALSQAVIAEAQQFQALNFAHNDIKPENFLYKKSPDGSYTVKFIDWATGGFEQVYLGTKINLFAIFAETFGDDLNPITSPDGSICADAQGRFVKQVGDNIHVGVNPRLEILHGARNTTLPYITPAVLGDDRAMQGLSAGQIDSSLDTRLKSHDPAMDNWALTAMIFGVCNRQAYFALVKGRAVADYVVPGVLEPDGNDPLGLKIVNLSQFNTYFACGDDINEVDLRSGSSYNNPHAVMYIPSNQREGEPLHLYRHLQALRNQCVAGSKPGNIEESIVSTIDKILATVHRAIAAGNGLTKEQLKSNVHLAQACIKNYEKLHDPSIQQATKKADTLQEVLTKYQQQPVTIPDLLQRNEDVSDLDILCTYAASPAQQEAASAILDQVITSETLSDIALGAQAPYQHLFTSCIANDQSSIVTNLLKKITQPSTDFIKLVREQGLLHCALEHDMTEVGVELVDALQRAGASKEQMFNLMLLEYGPGKDMPAQPHIKWASNAFHIAIRNNNEQALNLLLTQLPSGHQYDDKINSALHLCAMLSNPTSFALIVNTYNACNPNVKDKITAEKIVTMIAPPDDSSPYHLFLTDEKCVGVIDWQALKTHPRIGRQFLLTPPATTNAYPTLIAAKNGNLNGLEHLFELAASCHLSNTQWITLFQQTDTNGKNLLNYLLEQGQFDYLNQFIERMKTTVGSENTTVLVHLLSNIHPVNPLENFLKAEPSSDQQFKVTSQLLDAICDNYRNATPEQQQARMVALLVNKDWLITQASQPAQHKILRNFLYSDALSMPYKQALFAELAKNTQNSIANTFYSQLLTEISPEITPEGARQIALELPAILQQVTAQQADIKGLIKTLTKPNVTAIHQQLSTLRNEIAELTTAHIATEHQLTLHQTAAAKSDEELKTARSDLSKAQLETRRLSNEITRLIAAQQAALIAAKTEGDEALRAMQQSHTEALQPLHEKLRAADKLVERLSLQLQEQAGLLQTSQEAVKNLTHELEALSTQNKKLNQRLVASDAMLLEHKEEKTRLSQQLAQQQKETTAAHTQAKTLLQQLNATNTTNTELQAESRELKAQNSALQQQVTSLSTQITDLTANLRDVNNNLARQTTINQETQAELTKTRTDLSKAQRETQRLSDEVDSLITAQQEALAAAKTEGDEALQVMRQHHTETLQPLQDELRAAYAQVEGLSLQLEEQAALLQTSQETANRLTHELEALSTKNQELNQHLATSATNLLLSTEENARLSQELKQQLKEISDALAQVETLQKQLTISEDTNTLLQTESLELKAQNGMLRQEVALLSEQIDTLNTDQTHLHNHFSQKMLDLLNERVEKATQLLEKFPSLTTEEVQRKITKHISKKQALCETWSKLQYLTQENIHEFERLTQQWETAMAALQERLNAQRASDEPIPEHVPPAAATVIEAPGEEPSPASQLSSMRIFALLNPTDKPTIASHTSLFRESDSDALIVINFPERQLTEKEVAQFVSKTGLNVESPSGHHYAFSYENKIPKAVLTEDGARRIKEESPEKYQQRLAVTIINMIDNVLSKGSVVKINTQNPFIAKIAQQYLDHLKNNLNLKITHLEITGCDISAPDEKSKSAETIFNKLSKQLSKTQLQAAPWFIEAQALRKKHDAENPDPGTPASSKGSAAP